MNDWKQILVLCIPLLMNWWEVRKLRKEVSLRLSDQDDRIAKVEDRLSAVEKQLTNGGILT